MSAADVFIHQATGIEEASPLAIHEAQSHALPVIAARWAGIPEVVAEGETGFLIETRVAPLRPQVATTLFGETDRTHLVHAGRLRCRERQRGGSLDRPSTPSAAGPPRRRSRVPDRG
jgi:glycosyltransferase involved in cell wall biosynthesis